MSRGGAPARAAEAGQGDSRAATPDVVRLDHLVIAVRDLEAATRRFSALLGRTPSWRGAHPGLGTENTLFTLENTYVELLAPAGEGPVAGALRARLGARGEGLAALAFAVEDPERAARALRERGVDAGAVREGEGRHLESGAVRRWRWLVLPTGATRGVPVLLIRHEGGTHGLPPAPATGAERGAISAVDHVVVRSDDPDATRAVYGDLLGIRLALDRTFPQWGARLLFFRTGGLTVEVAAPAEPPPSPASEDSLWGISWRTPDVAAAHARLAAAGFELSPVRPGRRPGTRVFTVRGEPHGVAMLVLGPDPGAGEAPAAAR